MQKAIEKISPGSFVPSDHWYPKALNAQIHPLVNFFMNMSHDQIITRYCYLNPRVDKHVLKSLLTYKTRYFRWAGTDLMHATTPRGQDRMVVIETNSCPSGQKSFPLLDDHEEQGGYYRLLTDVFFPQLKKHRASGVLAVFYDKNYMENAGYAGVLADLTGEEIYLVPDYNEAHDHIRTKDQKFHINVAGNWLPVRAAFRYVTQKPWNRIPIYTKTLLLNPIICCLAGGRNKLLAAKAYDMFNAELLESSLAIRTPTTIWNVSKKEIPLWLEQFRYKAVVKMPYSNAGQGVYVITNKRELDKFMEREFEYEQFIIQQLIGHPKWSTSYKRKMYFQVGTVPNKRDEIYVFDVRLMVANTTGGFSPIATYSRRTRAPLVSKLTNRTNGLSDKTVHRITPDDILITNLSYKDDNGEWGTDTSRLMLMDRRDFNKLGLSLDDLISGYIQTVMAVIAIDKMAEKLISKKGTLKRKLYKSLVGDNVLLDEIMK
ncbi:hypothetical protein KC726_03610 [Candidatus Woesebacteria bacterium]|nr:hypothetical protein [Candidatus Woesebacteria bacterium]